jgi:hypothetical protein
MPAPWPLRFGVFYAPFHPVGQSPTLALEYDLERVVALDAMGYDEAWFGEHHSGGYEIIACPEIFIAEAILALLRSDEPVTTETHFTGHLASTEASHQWAISKREHLFGRAGQAILDAITTHVEETSAATNGGAS